MNDKDMNMSKTMIDKMVDRFLGWKLPKDFCPDAGISFKPNNPHGHELGWWPVGTNLLTADQARQMFEHALGDDLARLIGLYERQPESEMVTVTREMAMDAGCPEMEGARVQW